MALKILVVDDSAVMRKMIIRTINLCGLDIADIYEADDGRAGLDILKKKKVDLLFVDVNMPVMDGLQMLSEIRKRGITKHLPVLIVSTESNENRIREIERQNAGFVHKPFTPELLKEKMLRLILPEKV
ncbi:MAG TPA: response regulator [Bacteroidales bacterium]|nr:response regulator [Bacteroidales bacterium]